MRIPWIAIFAAAWTAMCLWSCGGALAEMRPAHGGTPGGDAGIMLGMLFVAAVWLGGLMALALCKFLFGGKK